MNAARRPLADWLDERLSSTPTAEAITLLAADGDTTGTRRLTWSDLAELARSLDHTLAECGAGQGARVAVRAAGTPASGAPATGAPLLPLVALLACALGKRVLAPLHGRWPASLATQMLADIAPDVLLDLRSSGAPGPAADAPWCEHATWEAEPLTVRVMGRRGVRAPAPAEVPNAMALLLPTSGTTAQPAWAVLGEAAVAWNAQASCQLLGLGAADRWLAAMPLYHVGGLSIFVRGLASGAATVALPEFSVPGVERALAAEVTGVSLVPTMLHRLLEAGVSPAGLRVALVGGAGCASALVERAIAAGWPVRTTYGLTEAASQVATMPAGRMAEAPGASGLPLPGVSLRIAEPDAAGAGEIVVRGPGLFSGYVARPERTARALRGGELWTGDIGRLRADGLLEVLDRREDLVVTGGENVVPARVEAVLEEVAGVRCAAVVGVPDEEWGQRLVAALELDGSTPPVDVLTACEAHARARLARHEVPRGWRLTTLPRTGSGKLRRAEVRAWGAAAFRHVHDAGAVHHTDATDVDPNLACEPDRG